MSLFPEKLLVGRPNIPNREKLLLRLNDALDRKWLSNNGKYAQEFEKELQKFIGTKHVIIVNNATIGLEIAIRALGLKGEVIVPSFTFVATVHALQWQKITPVFCDIDPETHNLDPKKIEKLITPKTSGILGVHLWGRPADTDAIENIAADHRLSVLFDAAHAFGCSNYGQMIGNFGNIEVFSFHATKFLNSCEGGAISTNSDELAQRVRLMKNFGFNGPDNIIYVGTNGKMTEFSAIMGLTSLEEIDKIIAINKRNYLAYKKGLENIPGVKLLQYNENEKCNYQYIVLEVEDRDDLLKVLVDNNIIARKYFYPGCHRMEPYKSYFPNAGLLLPETERMVTRTLVLPTGSSIDEEIIEKICGLIRQQMESR